MNKLVTLTLTALMAGPTYANKTTGIAANSLKIECSGTLKVVSYSDIGIFSGFSDRAGKDHPGYAYATLHEKVQSKTAGCELQKKTES